MEQRRFAFLPQAVLTHCLSYLELFTVVGTHRIVYRTGRHDQEDIFQRDWNISRHWCAAARELKAYIVPSLLRFSAVGLTALTRHWCTAAGEMNAYTVPSILRSTAEELKGLLVPGAVMSSALHPSNSYAFLPSDARHLNVHLNDVVPVCTAGKWKPWCLTIRGFFFGWGDPSDTIGEAIVQCRSLREVHVCCSNLYTAVLEAAAKAKKELKVKCVEV